MSSTQSMQSMQSPGGEILNMDTTDGLRERVEHCVGLVGESIGKGECILIHCKHGIHRSGSFMVLVLALIITLNDIYNGGEPHTEWLDAIEQAWTFWNRKRGLAYIDHKGHNYEQESWKAVHEYFEFLSESDAGGLAILLSRGIQRGCGSLRRTKEIINAIFNLMVPESKQSVKSQQSKRTRSRSPKTTIVLKPRAKTSAKARPRAKGSVGQEMDSTASSSRDGPAVPDVPAVPPPAPPGPPAARERGFLPGDWHCRKCGNHNQHWRGFCNGKSRTKPCREPRNANWRPGDWYCACGNFNWSTREYCNRDKCGLYRKWPQNP